MGNSETNYPTKRTRRHLLGILAFALAMLAGYWIYGRWRCLCRIQDMSDRLTTIGLSILLVLAGWAFLRKAPIWCWIALSVSTFALFAYGHPLAEAVLGR